MKTLFSVIFLLTSLLLTAQTREKAFEINSQLGRGINFGNIFEAPSETAWGNPWKPQYPQIIADLGFNHVRIPFVGSRMKEARQIIHISSTQFF